MTTVRELMTPRPEYVRETTDLRSALEKMIELDVRHLPVVNADRELVGILSDRDFRALPLLEPAADRLMGDGRVRLGAPVSSLMSSDVLTVEADDDVSVAVELMLEHRLGAVPVVTPEGRLIGIVSYVDVLRSLTRLWAA